MENVPAFVSYTFVAITIAALSFIISAVNAGAHEKRSNDPIIVLTILISWLFLTALLTFLGFTLDFAARPPRLFLLMILVILPLIVLFSRKQSRAFFHRMPLTTLTYIHIIRVPVELVLWWLASAGVVATQMTFEGSNFDILTGVTAPFAAVFLIGLKSKSKFAAIVWNIAGLALLANIVQMAIRATPYFYDPEAFDQPNVAVFYFPFIWLPTFVVPAVLFSHLVCLYKLFTEKEEI
ncbi:MAG: hypothetical protein AAGA85_23740 [Bacteroidota bacterium]